MTRRRLLVAAVILAPGAAASAPPDRDVRVPIVVDRNQPLVALQLDGRGPFTFLIDTGASGFGITASAAARAGLASAPRAAIAGVSGRAVAVRTWFAHDVRAEGVDLGLTRFAEFPSSEIDGYLPGNALLARPTAFAFAEGALRLLLTGRPDTTGYDRVATRFDVRSGLGAVSRASLDPHIVVEAALDGRLLRLAVDTGAQAAVALLPQASARYWDRTPALDIAIAGATGRTRGRIVRAGPLQLGGVSTPDMVLNLTDPDAPHEDSPVDGLLGMDVLRQLDLIVDAPRAELWIRRNPAFGQAFRYNRSGLSLRSVPTGLEVISAAPGSPAAAEGLSTGDVLTPARSMSREAFAWSLEQAPGIVVDMDATRGGATRRVALVLKELI